MPLKVESQTIPVKFMRYKTVGDWYGHDRHIITAIAEMGNPKYEFLLFIHEVVEAALCMARGVDESAVTKFDIEFEKSGKDGEPGDDPAAPYHKEHVYATAVEYSLCKELGLDPSAYDRYLTEYINKNLST